MARVTVEDCVGAVPNRFDLVLLSAQRARELSAGADALVAPDKDKNAVIALREIADKAVVPAEVQENIVKSLQMRTVQEEMEQETVRAFAARRRQLSTASSASHDAPESAKTAPAAAAPAAAGADESAAAASDQTADQAAQNDAQAEDESQSAANKEAAEKPEQAEKMPESMTEEKILGELRKQSESSRSEHEMRGGDE